MQSSVGLGLAAFAILRLVALYATAHVDARGAHFIGEQRRLLYLIEHRFRLIAEIGSAALALLDRRLDLRLDDLVLLDRFERVSITPLAHFDQLPRHLLDLDRRLLERSGHGLRR